MATPLWLHHPASLGHDVPGHPERPERIAVLEAALERQGWLGWRPTLAPAARRAQLLAVHAAAHVDFVESLCARGGGYIDADTAAVPSTWEAAVRAAGGACAAVDAVLGSDAPTAFSGLRPPGHHAEAARAMGFCFFDSVAVAARWAIDGHGLERVLVFDWDVHHGNGTNDIFHADPRVLFASIHQSPLYPGTGAAADVGSGPGLGYTVNLPVPPGSGDEAFRSLVDHVVAPLVAAFSPQLVLVSAGFDAHRADPLAQCRVTEEGYAAMAASVRRAAADVGAPVGAVLEGGYATAALASSVSAVLPVLGAPTVPADVGPAVPVHPLAREAAARLAPWWPGVGEAIGAARA
jgi:acetoin utilization deacetylase AcuC-like enzyme